MQMWVNIYRNSTGQQILPRDWVAEATQPDRDHLQPGRLFEGYPMGYQYQWWVFPGEDRAYTAAGMFGQFVYVNPADNMVIVTTSAWPHGSDGVEKSLETFKVFEAIGKALH